MKSQYDLDSLKKMTDKELIWLITFGHKKINEHEEENIIRILELRGFDTAVLNQKSTFKWPKVYIILITLALVFLLVGKKMLNSEMGSDFIEKYLWQIFGLLLYNIGVITISVLCLKFIFDIINKYFKTIK